MNFLEKLTDPSRIAMKRYAKELKKINSFQKTFSNMTDEQLKQHSEQLKRETNEANINSLVPEAFALVREATKRTKHIWLHDVQMFAAMALHEGNIAELATGEGKGYASAPTIYLNAMLQKGIHVVTANEYLAKRDTEDIGEILEFLGISVGCITNSLNDHIKRKNMYLKDVTYGTSSEFGFDYLRDNMVDNINQKVQRPFNFAIIDEADSILIDEAKTPLIISGGKPDTNKDYKTADRAVKGLNKNDYTIDKKDKGIALTESGNKKIEKAYKIDNISDIENINIFHFVYNALKANYTMAKDVDYAVIDGEVMIIDEFTGRILEGRRYSDGLHQAIEAKEHIHIKPETETLATITIQNYFRMYHKLAGMTGTAKTEEDELRDIYNMNVIQIPTNLPVIRIDNEDKLFSNKKTKWNAVCDEIEEQHKLGRPILIGTTSVENSEILSKMLKKRGIKHNILNAKNNAKEAEIIAQAGRTNAITVSTNMAGRGTDIKLGGDPEILLKTKKELENYNEILQNEIEISKEDKEKVISLGGLLVIGTERHEARRIDNQLIGRSGRQGDPGESKFFLSLEDEIIHKFIPEFKEEEIQELTKEDNEITEKKYFKLLYESQITCEANNANIRKYTLKFDEALEHHRNEYYHIRDEIITGYNTKDIYIDTLNTEINKNLDKFCDSDIPEYWDIASLNDWLKTTKLDIQLSENNNFNSKKDIQKTLEKLMDENLLTKYGLDEETKSNIMGVILMKTMDTNWISHLATIQSIREGIGLRGIGQQDPVAEFNKEAQAAWGEYLKDSKYEALKYYINLKI